MERLNRIFRLGVGFLACLYLVSCGSGDGGGGIGGGNLQVEQIIGDSIDVVAETSNGVLTGKGYFSVPFVKDIQDRRYVNVVVDFSADGTWKTYTAGDSTQIEWIAKNIRAFVTVEEPSSLPFFIDDASLISKGNFKARVILTDLPIIASSETGGWDGTVPADALASKDFIVSQFRTFEVGAIWTPDPDEIGSTGAPLPASVLIMAQAAPATSRTSSATISAKVLADDLIPDSVYHPGVPNIRQGLNECVPTAAANSLLWLAKKYGFSGKMPDSQEALITELKGAFNWSSRRGVVVASPKENTVGNGYLDGMGQFVKERQLPIEVHQIGGRFDGNIFPQIMAELKKGQDVILDLEYSVPLKGRVAGHGITIVGAWTDYTGTNHLDVHDPASPAPGVSPYVLDGTTLNGFRRGLSVNVRFAFAQSPTATSTTPPPVTPPVTPPTTPPTPVPEVLVNPASLSVVHGIGTSPCPTRVGSIFIGESIPGTLNWSITGTPSWLTLGSASGTINSTASAFEVSVDFNCQVPSKGTYSTILTVTGRDASGNITSSKNITVTVTVN